MRNFTILKIQTTRIMLLLGLGFEGEWLIVIKFGNRSFHSGGVTTAGTTEAVA